MMSFCELWLILAGLMGCAMGATLAYILVWHLEERENS